jgi:hypothetical protein
LLAEGSVQAHGFSFHPDAPYSGYVRDFSAKRHRFTRLVAQGSFQADCQTPILRYLGEPVSFPTTPFACMQIPWLCLI